MGTDSSGSSSPRRWEEVLFWLIVGAAVFFYFWSAGLGGAPRVSLDPDGPYNLQAEGFRHGHLSMAVQPDPALLALPDPYDPSANAPYRIHDMTLWRGKYYLYFGVAPVLLVFLPFRLLTGHFVTEPVVVALFTSLGLLLSAKLLLDVRRRWFAATRPALFLALAGVLGFGCPTVFLVQMPQFYQVPISCAYMLAMGGLFCIARVLAADGRAAPRWLLASGICMGLTLASRPNYILAMPLLIIPCWWLLRGDEGWRSGWKKWWPPVLTAFGPVAAVGASLLVYNALRFGNALEFGMRYQLAGQSCVNFTPLALKYLAPHFSTFVWKGIWWLPYFPFIESEPEAPFGLMRYLPVMWLGLAAFWRWEKPLSDGCSRRLALALAIGWLGAANLVMDSLFAFAPEIRYVSDFAPGFLMLGALGALSFGQTRSGARWAVPVVVFAAAASVLFVFGVYVQRMPEAHRPFWLARFSDRLATRAEEAMGLRFGELRMEVEIPRSPAAAEEPLFQTGHASGRSDALLVHYVAPNRAQLGLFHAGLGEILGTPVSVPADRRLLIEAASSAFLPPGSNPIFESWTSDEIAAAQRTLQVRVNGSTVLEATLPCYPSRPWDLRLGTAGFPGDAARPRFSGKILSSEMLPARRVELAPKTLASVHGVLSLRLQMPALGGGFEPLIATGDASWGQLLYLAYGPNHSVRFALNTFGSDTLYSRPLPCSPSEVYTLKAWIGAWAAGKAERADWAKSESPGIERRFFVSLNGFVLFDEDHQFIPGADSPTAIGWNRINSGAAAQEFSGRILAVETEPLSTLPARGAGGQYGAVDMRVLLPESATGQDEPLVATGEPGAGDILYIRYVDDGHVVVGLDTGGGAGPSTDPLPVDYTQPQHIEISMGSLYPPGTPQLGRRLLVRLNGQVIIDGTSAFHRSSPDQVRIASNPVGGSSCGWEFTGRILSVERPGRPGP
jgi:hypothetical protein